MLAYLNVVLCLFLYFSSFSRLFNQFPIFQNLKCLTRFPKACAHVLPLAHPATRHPRGEIRERDKRERKKERASISNMSYSFPILSNDEIRSCLKELKIDLSERDLLRPTHESLRHVYESAFELFYNMDLDDEETFQPDPEIAEEVGMEFPELYEDAIPNLLFLSRLQELMMKIGVEDFSFKDVWKPEYTRTRRNMSALINFAKFREEQLIEFADIINECAEAEEKLKEVKREHERLRMEVERAESRKEREGEREEDEEELRRLEKENKILEEEVAEQERVLAAQEREIAEQEEKAAKEKEELEKLEEELAKAEKTNKELKEKMEEERKNSKGMDPELQKAMGEMKIEEDKVAKLEEQVKEMEEDKRVMEDISERLREAIDVMEKIIEEQEKQDKMKESVEETKKQIAENEEETWKLDAKLEQLKRQEQTLNERMQRLKAQGELKEQAARAALKSAEEALEAEKARAESNRAKTEEEEREILAIKKNMNRVREEHIREMDALGKKFLELRQTVRNYHSVLFEAMSRVDEEIYQLDENGNNTTGTGAGDTPMSEMSSPGGLSPAGFHI